ncbi:hypothetical protein [Rhizobium straminoryzae]|uniref:Uncharacterized protein n=1 Tax=Rhizobium straminoryzae TaxID=1387186 RepID=A0A549TCX2_9HYPH|nr:hypothetical protein [Rhizobium straminoryzae]TRL39818.1 hypothetical protein FNA46_07735 [Rhizobium straminoryzae]
MSTQTLPQTSLARGQTSLRFGQTSVSTLWKGGGAPNGALAFAGSALAFAGKYIVFTKAAS